MICIKGGCNNTLSLIYLFIIIIKVSVMLYLLEHYSLFIKSIENLHIYIFIYKH